MEKTLEEQQFEGLKSADEYIVKLINGINMCIANINESKYDEASNLLSYIITGIEWLNEIARLTKELQKDNMDEDVMKEKIEELKHYAIKNNFNQILFLFKDDILPLLEKWHKITSTIMLS